MELYSRIHSKRHAQEPKKKLLAQLPPCIAWDLALARKWRDCMSIEKFNTGGDPEQSEFHVLIYTGYSDAFRSTFPSQSEEGSSQSTPQVRKSYEVAKSCES
jgi:hypothetical protein